MKKKKHYKYHIVFTVATVQFICFCVTDEALVVMESANPELYNVSLRNYARD